MARKSLRDLSHDEIEQEMAEHEAKVYKSRGTLDRMDDLRLAKVWRLQKDVDEMEGRLSSLENRKSCQRFGGEA